MFRIILMILLLGCFVVPAVAEPNIETSSRRDRFSREDIDTRLVRKARRLNRVVTTGIEYMTLPEKRRTLELITRAIQIARGEGDVPGDDVIIKAYVEEIAFMFEVGSSGLEGFLQICTEKVRAGSSQNADDIKVIVSGVQKRAHTSGWWKTPRSKCQVIVQLALDASFQSGTKLTHSKWVVHGEADGQGILAEGNSLGELERSCQNLTRIDENVDDMVVRLNDGVAKTSHTSGWWKTTEEVCNHAIGLVIE